MPDPVVLSFWIRWFFHFCHMVYNDVHMAYLDVFIGDMNSESR